jgi:FtsZ-binding cell division protein ZapB
MIKFSPTDTQKVVRLILNELPADQETPDVREATQAVQDWMTQNRNIRARNKQRQERLRALKAR